MDLIWLSISFGSLVFSEYGFGSEKVVPVRQSRLKLDQFVLLVGALQVGLNSIDGHISFISVLYWIVLSMRYPFLKDDSTMWTMFVSLLSQFLYQFEGLLGSLERVENEIDIYRVVPLASLLLVVIRIAVMPLKQDFDTSKSPIGSRECIGSVLTFSWINDLAQSTTIDDSTLPNLHHSDTFDSIKDKYIKKKYSKSLSLLKRLASFSSSLIIVQLLLAFLIQVLISKNQTLLYQTIKYFQSGKQQRLIMLNIIRISFYGLIKAICAGQMYYLGKRIGINTRTILTAEVYGGMMKRNCDAGDIGILMDIEVVRNIACYLQESCGLFQVSMVLSFISLYNYLGNLAILTMLLLILTSTLQYKLGKQLLNLEKLLSDAKAERLKETNEALNCMKMIKVLALEDVYWEKIAVKRRVELQLRRKLFIYRTVSRFFEAANAFIIPMMSLSLTGFTGRVELDAAKIFSSLQLISSISKSFGMFHTQYVRLSKGKVALDNIARYLKRSEDLAFTERNQHISKSDCVFMLKNMSAKSNQIALKNVDLEIRVGELTLITGKTGSGKSSLLKALMNELPVGQGVFKTNGMDKIAYLSQSPTLFNGTIRDNILFGEPFDSDLYQKVLDSCSLSKDLLRLKHKDLTIVGDSGMNLSGGQKQRICLARACYSKTDVVMLDDPFSALDEQAVKTVMEKCILGLMGGRTRIVVSNHEVLKKHAQKIVYCANGTVQECPKDILNEISNTSTVAQPSETTREDANECIDAPSPPISDILKLKVTSTWKVYQTYLQNANSRYPVMYLITVLLNIIFKFVADYYMKLWTDKSKATTVGDHAMYFYMFFSAGHLIGFGLKELVISIYSLQASNQIYSNLLTSTLYAPLQVYESLQSGKLLNLFVNDIETIDSTLMSSISGYIVHSINAIGLVWLTASVSSVSLILLPTVIWFYCKLMNRFHSTSKKLKGIEAQTRSPILSLLNSTLQGSSTIRTYKVQELFAGKLGELLDRNHNPYLLNWALNRWISLRTDFLSNFIVLILGFILIKGNFGPGTASLVFSYTMKVTDTLFWTSRLRSIMEMNINSFERINRFCQTPREFEPEESKRPKQVFENGSIRAVDLKVSYGVSSPNALSGISFRLDPKEKLAIIGPTGQGKSTLLAAFFKLVDIEPGQLFIDDVDVYPCSAFQLRNQMMLITQEPLLMSGTLKMNLDPLNQFNDDELFAAVVKVGLFESISTDICKNGKKIDLNHPIGDKGGNTSLGQAQLICFARALLRKPKILFLDEPTASIDLKTETRITRLIQKEFSDCTVVCVSHRLHTIIDYDKVLVLDRGKMVAFGAPAEILPKLPTKDLSNDKPTKIKQTQSNINR